jgi:hypothetical protein
MEAVQGRMVQKAQIALTTKMYNIKLKPGKNRNIIGAKNNPKAEHMKRIKCKAIERILPAPGYNSPFLLLVGRGNMIRIA